MLARVTRSGVGAARLGFQPRASYSIWDRVRPSLWHPLATLEQSMMEVDRMASRMLSAPFNSMMPRLHLDDDDFFKDLDMPQSMDEAKGKAKEKLGEVKAKMDETKDRAKDATQKEKKDRSGQPAVQSYSSYSYSSSTILDEGGHHVTSVRRRYEDSAGRLKAVHERQIDDKKVKSVWHKKGKDDKGKHKTICQSTDADEFEEEWKKTPFGQAEDTKPQGVVEAEKQSEKITPGPDYEAAEKAPEKEHTEEEEGVTKEAHDKPRDEAIAEGSKKQEEETTPPQYS